MTQTSAKVRSAATRGAAILLSTVMLAGCGQAATDQARSATDDALLAASVKARIAAVDAATVGLVHVASADGVVTLTGKIANETERTAMDKAAREVGGVKTLDDRVVVDPSAPTGAQIEADLTLSAKVHTALVAQTGINAATIHADVHRGVVTLTGTVPSAAHKAVADETVRGVKGVTSLVDRLTIAGR